MPVIGEPRTRAFTILAQDPSITVRGKALTARLDVPHEILARGPRGYRVHVIDYDASTDRLYQSDPDPNVDPDPYAGVDDVDRLVADARFHQQNVYAIVMATLARFENALGRRVRWGFDSHQIKVAPHAFADANAFYSKAGEALVFGYFEGRSGTVFSGLSHDVVAHETTHALLDGLRTRYAFPSSPDQAAFHEGLADIVAILSIFALPSVVGALLDPEHLRSQTIPRSHLTAAKLRKGILLGMAEQMGEEMQLVRGRALRQSATLPRSPRYLDDPEYQEPHKRGEIIVAATLNALVDAWTARLAQLDRTSRGRLDRAKVVEELSDGAGRLLNIAIRALDYTPTVDLHFGDFLSALLTADLRVVPDDVRFSFRQRLRDSFGAYGILPASHTGGVEPGIWAQPTEEPDYRGTHFESLQRDPTEAFRFIWQNRTALRVDADPYTRVLSVRPTLRVGPDGFVVHETVAEYLQTLIVRASGLRVFGLRKPDDMPSDTQIHLYGGGVLIFDEYGRLIYHVRNRLSGTRRQQERLDYLWQSGAFDSETPESLHFAALHQLRAVASGDDYRAVR